MTVTEHTCGCGEKFAAPGTVHGQPAGLWLLLEHKAARSDSLAECNGSSGPGGLELPG